MKFSNSTHKQFRAMFCQTMKQTSVMAILAFLCFMFLTVFEFDMYEPDSFRKTAHFFNELRWNGIEDMANLAFIGAGLLNAILSFNFAWSKKQSNVVLSLGMRKSDIYFSKILGGIVPMGITFLLAGIAETISNVAGNYIVDNRFFAMAAFTMLQYFAIYILSFVLSSAVMVNTGNVIEGTLFTGIIALFPMALKAFLVHTFWQFTHGAYVVPNSENYTTVWNWANPFEAFKNIEYEFMQTYFYNNAASLPSIANWSGIIMAIVYSVAIILLGCLGFRKRRNEICGTWGRAKGMNEIAGAAVGFYAAYMLGLYMFNGNHGDASALTYLICCGSFVLTYVVFKLIFGYKRKKEIKAAFNRVPVYTIGFAVIFMIFGMGLFSYSSKIPEVSEIKSVSLTSPYYKFLDECFAGDSQYALKLPVFRGYYEVFPDIDGSTYESDQGLPTITYSDYTDIEKVIKIHESFIRDGKIKNNGAHSCASKVTIAYTLKNGKKITRYYTESTEGTTLKLLALNDSDTFKNIFFKYLNSGIAFDYLQDYVIEKIEDGYLEITDDGEYIDTEIQEQIIENFTYHNGSIERLAQNPCYLFPTDMSSGYKLGYIEKDFYDAIITDLKNISTNRYFNHSATDEIGILSFGLSDSSYVAWDDDNNIVVEDKIVYEDPDNTSPDGSFCTTSWNVNSGDIKSVVITKDMKNTIEYLEEHDLMKHFQRKLNVQDIKSVKVATMSELCDGNYDNSELFPIFYGGFWTSQQMDMWLKADRIYKHNNYLFKNINNEITDRNQIKELVDNAVVFGYCPNDAKIVEITYKDGSVATALVRAD